ncbi:MAG: flagellar hook-length control protein FliK [Colwellia sp.]|nr:flagellar hook-length control protein FliK [Colwellia sp.]
MPQLNVLPINVAKNVDTKADSSALNSSTSTDGFSRQIDLQLAKNKDVSNSDNTAAEQSVEPKAVTVSPEKNSLKTDGNSSRNYDETALADDNTESTSNTQEVAASGKKVTTELNQEKPDEENLAVDDSELLMSFLFKADKTLIEESVNEDIKLGDISAKKKVNNEALLLLKSTDLAADLLTVAKVTDSNLTGALEESRALELTQKTLLAADLRNKISTGAEQVTTLNLIEDSLGQKNEIKSSNTLTDKTASGDLSLTDKDTLARQLTATNIKADEGVGEKNELLNTQKIVVKQSINNELVGNSAEKLNADGAALKEKAWLVQNLVPTSKNAESAKVALPTTLTTSNQTAAGAQNSLEVSAKTTENIAQLMQAQKSQTKPEVGFTSALLTTKNANSNKSSALDNLGLTSATVVKQNDSVASETQLTNKALEHLLEQSKTLNTDELKDVSKKVPAKTNADFSINSNFVEVTSRATQLIQDRGELQAAEIFNLTGSAEVSQSQKTNTQLHQETIAIFRRDFADAVKNKVMLMISQKLQQFDITLDPPELGNMQVRVNLQGEQATVNFVVQNQHAKEAFEQNMHKLKELLAEQGVDVGEASVEQQSDNETNNKENADESEHNSMANTTDASDVIEHNLSARLLNSSTTVVDYYA